MDYKFLDMGAKADIVLAKALATGGLNGGEAMVCPSDLLYAMRYHGVDAGRWLVEHGVKVPGEVRSILCKVKYWDDTQTPRSSKKLQADVKDILAMALGIANSAASSYVSSHDVLKAMAIYDATHSVLPEHLSEVVRQYLIEAPAFTRHYDRNFTHGMDRPLVVKKRIAARLGLDELEQHQAQALIAVNGLHGGTPWTISRIAQWFYISREAVVELLGAAEANLARVALDKAKTMV